MERRTFARALACICVDEQYLGIHITVTPSNYLWPRNIHTIRNAICAIEAFFLQKNTFFFIYLIFFFWVKTEFMYDVSCGVSRTYAIDDPFLCTAHQHLKSFFLALFQFYFKFVLFFAALHAGTCFPYTHIMHLCSVMEKSVACIRKINVDRYVVETKIFIADLIEQPSLNSYFKCVSFLNARR